MRILTAALFLIPILISAQDAIVIDLSPADTTKIAALYKQQKDIETQIAAERKRIGKTYATWDAVSISSFMHPDGTITSEEIPPSFDFSSDFRHIVPAQSQAGNFHNSELGKLLSGCGASGPSIIIPQSKPYYPYGQVWDSTLEDSTSNAFPITRF